MIERLCVSAMLVLLLGACQSGGGEGGSPAKAFDAISPGETVRFTGTEPFWGGDISNGYATYSTPENAEGVRFAVERFAGLNGVSFSGTVAGETFDLMVTPAECSDGMSDRTYPYAATLMIGAEKREGCAWTDRQPFAGPEAP